MHIIERKGKSYATTAFGSVICNTIQMVKLAHELQCKLQVIDAIEENVPVTEHRQIIESQVADKSIREDITGIQIRSLELYSLNLTSYFEVNSLDGHQPQRF